MTELKIFFNEENNRELCEAVRHPDDYPFSGIETMWYRCLDKNRHPICEPGEGLSYCKFGAVKAGAFSFVINPLDMLIDVRLAACPGNFPGLDDNEDWGGMTTYGLGYEYINVGALDLDVITISDDKDETLKGILSLVRGFINGWDIYGTPAKVYAEYEDIYW